MRTPAAVTPWQPRGDHFYESLRLEQPRKFGCKGVHAQHGGPVQSHAVESAEPVSVDGDRSHQRYLCEFSGGRDSDICGANKDFANVMAKHRTKPEEMRRQKGYLFSAQNVAPSGEVDGKWLKEMDLAGVFYHRAGRIGHQALGYAGGTSGFWGPPPPKRNGARQ